MSNDPVPFTNPAPRWQRRKDARPSEILAAALQTFAEHGYAATKLEDVARRAGVTKGTLYIYFESKDALFKAVVRENVVPILATAEQMADDPSANPDALLRRLVTQWWEAMGPSGLGALPKLVMSEAANFPELAQFWFDEVVQRGRQTFARVLRRGIDEGAFRPLDVDLAVRMILAPVLIAAIWKHSFRACEKEAFPVERYLESSVDIFLRGVVAKPAAVAEVRDA
ncbi:MAG TPA: TetR/AcrR family transcriptional regulator [Gemmatimonadales bacterium]|nr:TetR/AcrR family transcriptional regulator [Gemmatimonadales bacterium]